MIRTEQPNKGYLSANWDVASKRIQCWADAVDAMVFHLGDIAVLACDEHDARQAITEEDCSTELKEVRREIRNLKDKIYDLEEELAEYEEEELELVKKLSTAESLFSNRIPEWIRNHLTFDFMKEVRA
jgi:hypothetical protein